MKKLVFKSLIFLGLFSFTMGYSNPTAKLNADKDRNLTLISFKSVQLGSELLIRDINGLTLYRESIEEQGNYSKKFDLTALPDGEYFFEMDSETQIEVIPFHVVSNQVLFKKEEKVTVYKPIVSVKGKKALVSWVSFEESPMECSIYYSKNFDLVCKDTWQNLEKNGKVYDFSKAMRGKYLFVFELEGRSFTKTIKI